MNESDPQGSAGEKPVLVFTLERPKWKERAVIVYPGSYQDALWFARKAFDLAQDEKISLRRSIKKVEGDGYDWGRIIPEQWASVVRPNIDEIGVFLEEYRPLWNLMTHSRTTVLDIEADLVDADDITLRERSGTENKELHFIIEHPQFKEAHGIRHAIPLPLTYEDCQSAIRHALLFSYSRAKYMLPNGSVDDVKERFCLSGRYNAAGTGNALYSVLTGASYETFIATSSCKEGRIPVIMVAWPK